jgi:hypothetical protein
MANTLFLLGAGFNKDAKNEAGKIIGHSIYKGDYEIECGYPLIDELYRICFHDTKRNPTISIEDLFADAIKKREFKPLQRLYNTIMEADYYIITAQIFCEFKLYCMISQIRIVIQSSLRNFRKHHS